MPEQPLVFTGCLSIQFFDSPLTLAQSLCSTCASYGTPCRSIAHQLLPIQPLPREAEDFPRGGKYFKHCLCSNT